MYRIFYLSASRGFPNFAGLCEILKTENDRNKAEGLTGLLLYHDGSFAQVIEGPEEAVKTAFERIKNDDRHTGCKVIVQENISRRMFHDWHMAFASPDGEGAQTLSGFLDLQRLRSSHVLQEAFHHPIIASFIRSFHPALNGPIVVAQNDSFVRTRPASPEIEPERLMQG